jgi:hypothetical protein
MLTMRLRWMAQSFLYGFTFGGLLSTGRPSAPAAFFPVEDVDGSEFGSHRDGESGLNATGNLEMSDLDHDYTTAFSHAV